MNKRITKKVEKRLGIKMDHILNEIDPVTIHLNEKGQITNWNDLSTDQKEDFLEDFNGDTDYSHRTEKYPALTDLEHRLHKNPVMQSNLYPYYKDKDRDAKKGFNDRRF